MWCVMIFIKDAVCAAEAFMQEKIFMIFTEKRSAAIVNLIMCLKTFIDICKKYLEMVIWEAVMSLCQTKKMRWFVRMR